MFFLPGAFWLICGSRFQRIGVKTPQIHLRPMRTKRTSISTSGRMTLNTDLLDLPKDLGEFVIVHELIHLLIPNHGRVFK